MDFEKMINKLMLHTVLAAAVFVFVFVVFFRMPLEVNASESHRYTFTAVRGLYKAEFYIDSEYPVVAYSSSSFPYGLTFTSKDMYDFSAGVNFTFYSLNSDGSKVVDKTPVLGKKFELKSGEWVETDNNSINWNYFIGYGAITTYYSYYGVSYFDFTRSGIDIIRYNPMDYQDTASAVTNNLVYSSSASIQNNILSYLLNGTFVSVGNNYSLKRYTSVDSLSPHNYRHSSTSGNGFDSSSTPSLINVSLDSNGILSYDGFVVDDSIVKFKGVSANFIYNNISVPLHYDLPLSASGSVRYDLSLGNLTCYKTVNGQRQYLKPTGLYLIPYYVSNDGILYFGSKSFISLDEDASYMTETNFKVFNLLKSGSGHEKPDGVFPEDGDTGGFATDGTTVDDIPIDIDVNDSTYYYNGYKLKGFSSDYSVRATWDGTTASEIFDSDIILEERVYIRLDYAYKNAPGQVAKVAWCPFYFNASSGNGYVDVSEYASKDDTIFLRDVCFVPCVHYKMHSYGNIDYGDSWFYGSLAVVRLKSSGEGDVIQGDSGNLNHNNNSFQNGGGKYDDVDLSTDGSLDSFFSMMSAMSNFGSGFSGFIKTAFSWLPWWAFALLGSAIVIAVILRIIGR